MTEQKVLVTDLDASLAYTKSLVFQNSHIFLYFCKRNYIGISSTKACLSSHLGRNFT